MVVGLCGNERMITRGLGHWFSHASSRFSKKSSPGPEADLLHLGAREQRRVDVDRVRRRRHERGVAGPEQHPHEVRQAFLGADRGDDLGLGVELDAELALR